MHDYLFWAKMSPYMLLFDSYTFENFGKYFPNWHKLANSWQKIMFLRGESYPTWLFHPAQLFSNQKLSILHIYSILHNYSIVKSTYLGIHLSTRQMMKFHRAHQRALTVWKQFQTGLTLQFLLVLDIFCPRGVRLSKDGIQLQSYLRVPA